MSSPFQGVTNVLSLIYHALTLAYIALKWVPSGLLVSIYAENFMNVSLKLSRRDAVRVQDNLGCTLGREYRVLPWSLLENFLLRSLSTRLRS